MNKQLYVEQLFEVMSQLKKLIQNQTHESHEEKASTIMQYSALKFLKNSKNSTVGDIAAKLKLSKSSATQLIERLAKAELVHRVHDANDLRVIHLILTPAGEHTIAEMKKKFISKISKVLSKIPDEDLKELTRIHSNLIETLQKEQNN